MEVSDLLNKLKKEYLEIEPGKRMAAEGFSRLLPYLDKKPKDRLWTRYIARGAVFAAIALFVLGGSMAGIVLASQNSLPGDLLYPVKRVSEKVILPVSGNGQRHVERRATEVVETVEKRKDSKAIEEAVEEYRKAVLEEKKNVEKSQEKGERFKERLEEAEERFREVGSGKDDGDELINEAIETSKRVREEVKGEKIEIKVEDEKRDRDGEEDRDGSNSGKD